jgi:endo-1,4-beta-xylanase
MKARGFISLVTVLAFLASALLIGNVAAFTTEEEASIFPFAKGFEDGTLLGVGTKYTESNSVVSEVAHEGTKSLKVSNRTYEWEGPQIDLMGKLQKGETYYCSAWVYQDTDEPQIFRLTAYSCDDSSEDLYDGKFYTTIDQNLEVPSGVWTRLEGLYTYDYEGTAKTMVVYVEAGEIGFDFYVDDIVIAGPSVVNSDFEDESTKGWTGNGSTLNVSEEFAYSGDFSLKVEGRSNAWEGPVADLMGKLIKENTYYASAWVYQESGEPQTFRMTAYSRDDSSEDPYDGMFYKTVAENLEVPSGEWTRLEGLYTYEYTGEPSALTIYIESPEIGFDFYVDDVVVAGKIRTAEDDAKLCETSFEDSKFAGWTAQGTGEDAKLSINEASASDGIKSLLVTGRADTWQGAKFDLMNKVKKGQQVDISLWVYQMSGKDQEMRISICTDADGDPTYSTIAVDSLVPSRSWRELKGSHIISYTGELEQLFIYVESAHPTTDIGIDNVLITVPVVEEGIEIDIPSLKDVYADYFPIGVAVPSSSFDNELQSELIKKHFNSITAENDMKVDSMQPTEGNFNYAKGTRYVEFAQENDMRLRGHTLLWHQAVPSWIFIDDEGNDVSREVLLERMKTHIQTLIKYYGDKVEVWDVVNEAVGDVQPFGLRNSKWKQIIGDDYVIKAFDYAYEAIVEEGLEGKVKLYYNDYNNEENPQKREGILNLVKELKEKTHIDGVGHQGHIGIDYGSVEGVRETLKGYLDLGLEVELTELDMSVYSGLNAPDAPITEEQLIRQAYKYKELMDMLKELDAEYPDLLKGVTFWGLKDDMTWLNYYDNVNRTDAPLLFDKNGKAKYAYWALVDASKLPVFVNGAMSFKGTPVVDGKIDFVWDITKSIEVIDLSGESKASIKTLWDDKNLYALVKVDGEPSKIEFYIDEDNSKNERNEVEDAYYSFTTSGETIGDATVISNEVDGGYEFEVCMPFISGPSSKIGFDVRLTYGEDDKAVLVSWNDIKNTQDSNTSGYGALTLVNPKYTEAKRGTPTIDGDIDEAWADANEISTDIITAGVEPAKATVKTMWDEDYLYVLAEVNDTDLCDASENPWEQDSVELFVDENNGRTAEYEDDDAQYRVNYNNVPSFSANCVEDKFVSVTKVVYAQDQVSGYLLEAAIPFNTIEGKAGHIMVFDVQINDDSNADGVRDGMSNWNDATGVGYKNTEAFGLLKLVDDSDKFTISGYLKSDFTYSEDKMPEIESCFVIEVVGTGLKAESDNGHFVITGVPASEEGYTLKITKENYLAREIKDVVVEGDTEISTESTPIMMWAGDIVIDGQQDNAINMVDIMYICKSFNTVKGDENYIDSSDINKDGAINMEDIVIIGKHFNKISADYEE